MAKRTRKKPAKRQVRKVSTVAKRRTRSRRSASKRQSSNNMLKGFAKPLGGIAYGFMRENISDLIDRSPIGQAIPATALTDELVMLGVAFGARKAGLAKNPIGRAIIRSGEAVEWARVGQTFKDMMTKRQLGNGSVAVDNLPV